MITWQFRRLVSSVYQTTFPTESYQVQPWVQTTPAKRPHDQHLLRYSNRSVTAETEPWLRLINAPCMDLLTEDVRREFAADPDVYFVKTHERPFAKYFPGEKVIYVVRHPGPVCWSYMSLLNHENADKGTIEDFTLDEVVLGRVLFGSWSQFCETWLQALAALGTAAMTIDYAELKQSQHQVCLRIEEFTGLPYERREFLKFETVHQMNPVSARAGTLLGWETNYLHYQLRLLELMHGMTMRKLGYVMPSLADSLDLSLKLEPKDFIQAVERRAQHQEEMRAARGAQLEDFRKVASANREKADVRLSELKRHIALLENQHKRTAALEAQLRQIGSQKTH